DRSTTGWVRRRPVPLPAVSTASCSRSRAATSSSTPATSSSGRRSAPTRPVRARRGRCACDRRKGHAERDRAPMSFRTTLIVLNLVVFGGILAFIVYRVFSLRRNPEPRKPQNIETFFDDEVLEGPKLERVLFVSLISLVLIVVALVAYFLWEPFREADANAGFNQRSIGRGATLFANNQSP